MKDCITWFMLFVFMLHCSKKIILNIMQFSLSNNLVSVYMNYMVLSRVHASCVLVCNATAFLKVKKCANNFKNIF